MGSITVTYVHLCKPQYKSTRVDELSVICINFWYMSPTELIGIN